MCHCEHHADHECECGGHGHACRCGEGHGECECGCHGGHHFERRFQTKAEQIAELEAYLTDLKAEVQAVEEHLADLRR
jgi:hypothetical protein